MTSGPTVGNLKYCPDCGRWKPRTEFYKNAANRDGLHTYCKRCQDERTKPYNRIRERARRRAHLRLAEKYPDDFRRFYEEELTRARSEQ